MDDDDTIIFIFLVAAVHQLICAYYLLFDVSQPVPKNKELGLLRGQPIDVMNNS